MSEKAISKSLKTTFLDLIKGVFAAIVVSVVGILIFAVVLKFVNVSNLAIKVINQVIKVISIFIGLKVFTKTNCEKGILKGVLLGVLYTSFSYLIFSLLSNSFSLGLSFVFDIIFSCVFGSIFGIVLANSKRA